MAAQFLDRIAGKDALHTFQIIKEPKDSKSRGGTQILHGKFSDLAPQLERLNQAGNGIFFCVNQTDGKERKTENILKVRAVFADFDEVGAGMPAIAACGLKPSLTTESSQGKMHAYWLVNDCTLPEFKSVQQAIAAKLSSDKVVHDLPRVMRVAGFIHQKSTPFQTRIVEINVNEAYTTAEIIAGLALNLSPAINLSSKTLHSTSYDSNLLNNININRINSALAVFPLDFINERESWLRIGMSLHSHTSDLLQAFLNWSKQSAKFNEADAIYTWESLGTDKDKNISIASLFYEAKKFGWVDDSKPPKFSLTDEGVFYNGINKEGEPLAPEFVCTRLEILGSTCGAGKQDWGRYLEFADRSGLNHKWAMPMTLLAGEGQELRSELLRLGLEIATTPKAKLRLNEYIQSSPSAKNYLCTEKTGWHNKSYVLPHSTIGDTEVIFQSAGGLCHAYANKGASRQWRDKVAKLCEGNSRLVFAISSAFAAPLLHLVGSESGGFHYRGDSSTGKTTALRVASSVWGGLEYMQRWRATDNGLEGLAALHNDGLLVLDELSQCDPKVAGNIAYMLSNGSGKVRASKSGSARTSLTWRLLFLSAGEISLNQHMAQAGQRARAGQEVRLIDLPADAGKNLGVFETIHDTDKPAAFSKLLVENCTQYHGRVGAEYLAELCKNLDTEPLKLEFAIKKLTASMLPVSANGQVIRGAGRFALVGVAGELATKYGLTGWATGEAEAAAKVCFNAWVENRGGAGNQETDAILSQVRSFFEQHGESRFTPLSRTDERTTFNRAGFSEEIECAGDGMATLYYCLPEAYTSEICKSFDPKKVSGILKDAGWLQIGTDGKSARQKQLPSMGNVRCYFITPRD
jgi:uncharacterized protein (DUF927 family)